VRGRPFHQGVLARRWSPNGFPPTAEALRARARSPLVVFGNAVITIVLVLMIGAGAVYVYGRQKLEAPGPLQEDKVVNIPARAGMTDICRYSAARRRDRQQSLGVHRQRVLP